MEALMQNPMEIDPSLISQAEIQNIAISFLAAVKRFYEDPKNAAEFQEWKQRKKST